MDDVFEIDNYENNNNNQNKINNNKKRKRIRRKKIKENQKNITQNYISNEGQNKNIQKNTKKVYAIEDNIDISNYSNISPLAIIYPIELDTFQKRGIISAENHENVLACAHISSGKTIVAECAIKNQKI